MSNFGTIIPTTDTNSGDEYILQQGTVDRKQSRTVLSEGVAEDILNDGLLDNTATQKGVVQKADQSAMDAGADNTKFVTPALFDTTVATTSKSGTTTLATNSDTQSGTGSGAVTPTALASRTATQSRTGLIELATEAEAKGTNSTLAMTPSTTRAARSTLTDLALTPIPFSAVTLLDNWDNYEEIIIVYAFEGRKSHHTFYTDIISPSDSTTVFEYQVAADTSRGYINFRDTDRSQIYLSSLTSPESVEGIFGKGQR